MKFGVGLGRAHPAIWGDVTERADALGYESVWVAEHLVLPVEMAGSPIPGDEHPPISPNTPVYDAWVFLAYLAGRSQNINMGTNVYNLALRHPFVAARSISTLDVISGGRALAGLGASWLQSEWDAVGQDFHTRGKRMDEALEICIRLWTEERISHHGRFYDFETVMFEPKPVQKPHPPILIGGGVGCGAAAGRTCGKRVDCAGRTLAGGDAGVRGETAGLPHGVRAQRCGGDHGRRAH